MHILVLIGCFFFQDFVCSQAHAFELKLGTYKQQEVQNITAICIHVCHYLSTWQTDSTIIFQAKKRWMWLKQYEGD